MKTANAQTDAGNQNGQREYQAENLPAEQYAVNDAQNQADDEYKQNKIPVLRTVGTAVEVGIVIFQHVYEVGVEQGFDFSMSIVNSLCFSAFLIKSRESTFYYLTSNTVHHKESIKNKDLQTYTKNSALRKSPGFYPGQRLKFAGGNPVSPVSFNFSSEMPLVSGTKK